MMNWSDYTQNCKQEQNELAKSGLKYTFLNYCFRIWVIVVWIIYHTTTENRTGFHLIYDFLGIQAFMQSLLSHWKRRLFCTVVKHTSWDTSKPRMDMTTVRLQTAICVYSNYLSFILIFWQIVPMFHQSWCNLYQIVPNDGYFLNFSLTNN
jgi:hypothetical protein